MTLEVKKIYVDSRYRTVSSNSDSDFSIQLNRNIYLPEHCVMHIENCVIPHSWYTIEKDVNDKMYFIMNGDTTTAFTITIPSANYTGAQLIAALNLLFINGLTASYELNTNKIKITCPSPSQNPQQISLNSFQVLTDHDLLRMFNLSAPNSCNDVITNRHTKVNTHTSPWISGMINLQGFRSVYISSSTMCSYNTLGPQGEQNIIKKISTNADFGYLIIDHVVSDHDYLSCERMTLNTISFQIRDVKGNLIPFHDSPVSFTIVFTIQDGR